jgi:hypothetical protein
VLSPNVLLRPVIERALFPTVAYVAGPGEFAYFAQVQAVASALSVSRAAGGAAMVDDDHRTARRAHSCSRSASMSRSWRIHIAPKAAGARRNGFRLAFSRVRRVRGRARCAKAALRRATEGSGLPLPPEVVAGAQTFDATSPRSLAAPHRRRGEAHGATRP